MTTNYILFHQNCADGTASALAAYLYFGDEQTEYIPVNHGESPPPMQQGTTIYLLDFSYPRDILDELVQQHEVIVLDHHKTAKDDLLGYGNLTEKVFDMERSGAMISWQYFFPDDDIPKLFYYIQDRDLWQWQYKETKAISAFLKMIGYNHFREWLPYLSDHCFDRILEQGNAIAMYQEQCVKNQAKGFYWGTLPSGRQIWMNNCNHLISETCHKFLHTNKDVKVCCCWFVINGEKTVYSFRSKKGYDCSKIAKELGGGGHAQASGASIPIQA